jgi:hypothetical protein
VVSPFDWSTPPAYDPFPYRLRTAADGPHPLTGHQKLGIIFDAESCGLPLETTTQCITGVGLGPEKEPTASANFRGVRPFAVYTWLDCGLVGTGAAELRRKTLAAHERNVDTRVEEIFWTGGLYDTMPHLAENTAFSESVDGSTVTLQTAATAVTGTYDVVEAVGLLEGLMGSCYSGTPFLHMPKALLAHMAANHLLVQKGSRLMTPSGSIVVGAPGYPGTSPAGAAPATGTAWMYATGSVKLWQSEVIWTARDAREFLGRNINDTVLIAEQWFALGWDCCHYGVLTSTGGVITGTAQSAT